MPRGVQITIVTSLRGRCRFVESLKGITLNILIKNERLRLYSCIIVEQRYMYIFPEKLYSFQCCVCEFAIFKVPRYRMNNVRILACENRKIDKKNTL